mmetsp:Transcript_6249/g.11663  ORF Transcript_6249/g.11663 Transcript_6249/m.11663 type:complete len:408 (+) Transcript_6249:1746-2969(+)
MPNILNPTLQVRKLIMLPVLHSKGGLWVQRVFEVGVVLEHVHQTRGADEELAPRSDARDPRGVVHVSAEVVCAVGHRILLVVGLASVEAHADPQALPYDVSVVVVLDPGRQDRVDLLRPLDRQQLVLDGAAVVGGVHSAAKRRHEGVALSLHLKAIVGLQVGAEAVVVQDQGLAHRVLIGLPQRRAGLDVGEQERHYPLGPDPGVLLLLLHELVLRVDNADGPAQGLADDQEADGGESEAPHGDDEAPNQLHQHLHAIRLRGPTQGGELEKAGGQEAPEPAAAVDGEGRHGVVNLESLEQEVHAVVHEEAHEPTDGCPPRRHVRRPGRHRDQTSEDTHQYDVDDEDATVHVHCDGAGNGPNDRGHRRVERHPADDVHGMNDRAHAAAVEAVPAHPQNQGPDHRPQLL